MKFIDLGQFLPRFSLAVIKVVHDHFDHALEARRDEESYCKLQRMRLVGFELLLVELKLEHLHQQIVGVEAVRKLAIELVACSSLLDLHVEDDQANQEVVLCKGFW